MPVIQVNLLRGRPQQVKDELALKMTDLVKDVLQVDGSDVRIILNEMEPDHFFIDGGSIAARRRAREQP